MGRPLHGAWLKASLFTFILSLPGGFAAAGSSELIDRQSADFVSFLRGQSPEAAALMDRATAILVFPEMVAMGFGEGGRYGEGSLLVGGEARSYYVTAGEAAGPEAQLLLFMDAAALAEFSDERSWQALQEPPRESVIRLGWQNGDLQLGLPLAGSKYTRVAK